MSQLSEATKSLLLQYQVGAKADQPTEGVPTIHVDEVAAKVAAFYEKIRGIIDWREEHLLKRGAIQRMLKRRFLVGVDLLKEESTREAIAEPLVFELIRGGHYPNDRIPETRITDVQKTIDKYIFILKNTPQTESGQDALIFYNWFLSIAACEIEEILSSSHKERALIAYMYESMKERIILNEGAISIRPLKEDEKDIQIYIAVQRALFKLDAPVISYHLLKHRCPGWKSTAREEWSGIAKNMHSIKRKIERDLLHPLGDKFYQVCEKYDTPYLLLGDIISSDPSKIEKVISDPGTLEDSIRDAYSKRVQTLKSRLARAAIYATASIFITKILLALALEIPIDRYLHTFNILALTINIFTPPLLIFFLVSTIRLPGKENLDIVILETMKIIHKTEKKDTYEIKAFRVKRNLFLSTVVSFVYLVTFVLSLGLIIWPLLALNFSIFSIIIFIVFVSLIAFTGTKIQQRSKELQIVEEKEGFFSFLLDLFATPLVEVGNWLSSKWQKFNVISNLFNILIDMPFMIFVEFIEQWRYFLKEKKEKIH